MLGVVRDFVRLDIENGDILYRTPCYLAMRCITLAAMHDEKQKKQQRVLLSDTTVCEASTRWRR